MKRFNHRQFIALSTVLLLGTTIYGAIPTKVSEQVFSLFDLWSQQSLANASYILTEEISEYCNSHLSLIQSDLKEKLLTDTLQMEELQTILLSQAQNDLSEFTSGIISNINSIKDHCLDLYDEKVLASAQTETPIFSDTETKPAASTEAPSGELPTTDTEIPSEELPTIENSTSDNVVPPDLSTDLSPSDDLAHSDSEAGPSTNTEIPSEEFPDTENSTSDHTVPTDSSADPAPSDDLTHSETGPSTNTEVPSEELPATENSTSDHTVPTDSSADPAPSDDLTLSEPSDTDSLL